MGALKRRRVLIVALAVALLIPLPRLLSDEWTVSVIDLSGRPVGQVRVTQSWTHFTFMLRGGSERLSDTHGIVRFDQVRPWRPTAYWLMQPAIVRIAVGVHRSTGMAAFVSATDPRFVTIGATGGSCQKNCTSGPMNAVIRVTGS